MSRLAIIRLPLTWVMSPVLVVTMCGTPQVLAQVAGKADKAAILERILAAWRTRQSGVRTLEVDGQGEIVFPKDGHTSMLETATAAKGPVPRHDLRHPLRLRFVVNFDKNLFRKELRSASLSLTQDNFGGLEPEDYDAVFNNQLRQRVVTRPSHGEVDFRIYQDRDSCALTFLEMPFFVACGFSAVPDYRRLRPEFEDKHFELREPTLCQGRQCWIVRKRVGESRAWDDYCVDVDRDALVLAWTKYSYSEPFTRAELEYDLSVSSRPLTRFAMRDFGSRNRIRVAYTLAVSKFHINGILGQDEFVLEPAPGAAVIDYAAGSQFVAGTHAEVAARPVVVVWCLAALLGVALVLLYMYRRASKSSS